MHREVDRFALLGIAFLMFVANVIGTEPTDASTKPRTSEEVVETKRNRVDFYDWAGKVRITGKKVEKSPFDAADFQKWSGSVTEYRKGDYSRFSWGADPDNRISIRVFASPREAADRLLDYLFNTFALMAPGERVIEGELAVGDVAFPMSGLNPEVPCHALAFVRNNVAVVVTTPNRELLEELATFVDGKLVEALKPTADPAFSSKLEDPPAQGEAESESESENEEQAEAEK